MTALTRALAPAAVLLTLLAAGCAGLGSGSTAAPPAVAPSTPAATPAASLSATSSPRGGTAGTDIYFAEGMDVIGPDVQQPKCDTGCPVSGDGTTSLWHMTWATWNGSTAMGTGTEEIDDCQPNCAAGKGAAVKVIVTFSQPVKDCAGGGKWFWTQASFSWPNGLPAVLSGASAPKNPLDFDPIRTEAAQSCA